jgi:cytochrome P450
MRGAPTIGWVDDLEAWRVTGYDAAVQVLRDPVTFTVDDPRFSTARVVGPSMLSLDGAPHARHRTPFVAPFRPRQVTTRFSDFVAAETDRLLDRIDADPAGATGTAGTDLRTSLASPLATAVIAEALGLDGGDSSVVVALVGWYRDIVASVSAISMGGTPTAAGEAAFANLRRVVLAHLGDADRPSVLTAATAELDDDEVVSNAAVIMFGAIETTEGMILNLCWHLLTNPEQLIAVRTDRASIDGAVEESLRLEPAAAVVDRYATSDATLAGARIAAGEMVVVSLRDANRDPQVFPDPERFDVRRANARRHLAFAVGPHVCVGMDLARLQARTAVGALLARFPTIRLDPTQNGTGPRGDVFRKPPSLHVTW